MDNIKLVKIGTKKSENSLDSILNSSSRIRDMINKKKTLKNCRYLEKTDFKTTDNEIAIGNITIQKQPCLPQQTQTINCPPKNDLKSYGENLEKNTVSKIRRQVRSPRNPQSASIPITNFFKNEKKSSRKTKKYNRHEIKYIITSFKKMYEEKNYPKLNTFISKLTRDQTIQILYSCNLVEYRTDAPLPLLKNIVFNIVLGNIQIMR
jgi:hypothetical protein